MVNRLVKWKSKPQQDITSYLSEDYHQRDNNKCWWGCGEKGTLIQQWWGCKLTQPLWKTVWRFLKKLKPELTYDPAIPLLGLYSKKKKTLTRKGACTPMFTAALLTRANTWKQTQCPSTDNWMCEYKYTHNGLLLSHRKQWNFAICSNADGPGASYVNKVSQTQKCCMLYVSTTAQFYKLSFTGTGHASSTTYYLWWLFATVDVLSSCDRDHVSCNIWNIYYLGPLQANFSQNLWSKEVIFSVVTSNSKNLSGFTHWGWINPRHAFPHGKTQCLDPIYLPTQHEASWITE